MKTLRILRCVSRKSQKQNPAASKKIWKPSTGQFFKMSWDGALHASTCHSLPSTLPWNKGSDFQSFFKGFPGEISGKRHKYIDLQLSFYGLSFSNVVHMLWFPWSLYCKHSKTKTSFVTFAPKMWNTHNKLLLQYFSIFLWFTLNGW